MPFTCSFHHDPSPFVLLRAIGAVNLVMWSNAMRQVIADRAFRETMPVLLDVTEASWAPQPDETVIVARIWRLLAPRSCGAIIASEGVTLGIARQIEQLSEEQVRAFADFPTAVQWLHDSATRSATQSSHVTRGPSRAEPIASAMPPYTAAVQRRRRPAL
jgi:hypothetical protein